jgi:hypothetical protein
VQEFKRASAKLDKLAKGLGRKTPRALRRIGEDIMLDVKSSRPGKGVPVDVGTLRSSGQVTQEAQGSIALTFGGAAAPYALEQHENMDYHHTVGEARFLVRGVERWKPGSASAWRAYQELQQEVDRLAVSRGNR